MQNTPNNSFLLSTDASRHIQNIATSVSRSNRQKAVVWLESVLLTVEELASQPNMGAAFSVPDSSLRSLRRFRVRNHRAYWIYYRPFVSANGIEVLAVLHERQDAGGQLKTTLEP